jgi:multidrug efflux pump subunit AcrA (membrane-fusion protein)
MRSSESKQHWTRHPLVALAIVLAVAAAGYWKLGWFAKATTVPEPAAHAHRDHGAASPTANETRDIFIAPERQQLIGVRSVAVVMKSLTRQIRTVGKVAYDETRVTHIHTKVTGFIEETFVNYIGQEVKHGQPVFTIYSPDLVSTQKEYLLALKSRGVLKDSSFPWVAEGSNNLLEAAHERLRLWDVTEDEIQELDKEGKVKRAITVFAPMGGIVTQRSAYHHGMYVTPEMELYTLVDLSSVWVLGDIYESDLAYVRAGQQAVIEFPYGAHARRTGRIEYIYPFVDPKTRTAQARINFTNSDLALKPDMFVNLSLGVRLPAGPAIPEDALLDTGTEQYVFIDKGNGYFEPRLVKAGTQAEGFYAVESGLRAGERVVTGANFVIDSESRLKGALANMGRPEKQVSGARFQVPGVAVEIIEPTEARVGSNMARLKVRDASGAPVDGAEVEIVLFMPAMGSMPSMNSRATLKSAGNGEYAGSLDVRLAWTWQATVTVRKGGQTLGTVQTGLTAH